MSEFFVGQKIECIRAANNPGRRWLGGNPLVVGSVYTVRQIGLTLTGDLGLRIKETSYDRMSTGDMDIFFCASRFRPLESKAISLFRKIARDVTEGRKVEFVE